MLYRKFYKCSECGHEWDDVWECLCNDKCPKCNTEIEPNGWEEFEEYALLREACPACDGPQNGLGMV